MVSCLWHHISVLSKWFYKLDPPKQKDPCAVTSPSLVIEENSLQSDSARKVVEKDGVAEEEPHISKNYILRPVRPMHLTHRTSKTQTSTPDVTSIRRRIRNIFFAFSCVLTSSGHVPLHPERPDDVRWQVAEKIGIVEEVVAEVEVVALEEESAGSDEASVAETEAEKGESVLASSSDGGEWVMEIDGKVVELRDRWSDEDMVVDGRKYPLKETKVECGWLGPVGAKKNQGGDREICAKWTLWVQ